MKLLILGATGGTGLEVIKHATRRGHEVTAFVRSPERLKSFKDEIRVQKGNLLSSTELQDVLKGQEAVISAFGPRLPISKSDENLLKRFGMALTMAMPAAGVKRVVVESTAFLFKNAIFPPAYLVGQLFFADLVKDELALERAFIESMLDWTIVRPPRLTDKPYTGKFRVESGQLPSWGLSVPRSDVANCMVKAVEDPATISRFLGVST